MKRSRRRSGAVARAPRRPVLLGVFSGGLSLLIVCGCAGRGPTSGPPATGTPSAAEIRQLCPSVISAAVRIRVEPQTGPGATIDGTLHAILPDTLVLSGRLGVFHPLFALRADADSAELLLHDAKRYWVSARADEEWSQLNPSAWARVLGWALCPGDLLARLDDVRPSGGDARIRYLTGRLRASPYLAELGFERRSSQLVLLRIRDGDSLVLESRQRDFRRRGRATLPGVMEMQIPPQSLSIRVELLRVDTSRSSHSPETGRLRPAGWTPALPGELLFSIPMAGEDPG
jgi:hypothetical protein